MINLPSLPYDATVPAVQGWYPISLLSDDGAWWYMIGVVEDVGDSHHVDLALLLPGSDQYVDMEDAARDGKLRFAPLLAPLVRP
jgi:hypothetical protein